MNLIIKELRKKYDFCINIYYDNFKNIYIYN